MLGFPDHYYVSWDDASCEYVAHANSADLMSNSRAPGSAVTAEEFAALERVYLPE